MADYTLTADWDAIQERNIDPFSPVDSDNHNKLLKILGSHKSYVSGLDISFVRDEENNKMVAQVSSGIAVVNYVVLDFASTSTITLFDCPITERDICVVVEYKYQKIEPVPVAVIKTIRLENFDSSNQLKLYSYHVGNWSLVPTLETWNSWIDSEGNFVDERTEADSIPEWANTTFVKKSGDVVTSSIYMTSESPDNAFVTKNYVDTQISGHDSEHYDVFIRKDGDTMLGDLSIPLTPSLDAHAASKSYVDTVIADAELTLTGDYVAKAGDTMAGYLVLAADPREGSVMDAVTKQYVDSTISNHNAEHDGYFLKLSGGTTTGAVTMDAKLTLNATQTDLAGVVTGYYGSQDYHVINGPNSGSVGVYINANDADDAFGVFIENTGGAEPSIIAQRDRVGFYTNGVERSYVNENGLVGALYNADLVEFFEHDLFDMPQQGDCIVVNNDGLCSLSKAPAESNVLGFVSYSPGLILGGTHEFEKEFNNGRIPVALVGQIKGVKIKANSTKPAGTLLVSGADGKLEVYDKNIHGFEPGIVIAKSLDPLYKGTNICKVVIWR